MNSAEENQSVSQCTDWFMYLNNSSLEQCILFWCL